MGASATVGVTVTNAVGVGVGVVFGIEIAVGEGAGAGVSSSTHPANPTMIFKPDRSCFYVFDMTLYSGGSCHSPPTHAIGK